LMACVREGRKMDSAPLIWIMAKLKISRMIKMIIDALLNDLMEFQESK
jgi:hypothetical protein